MTKLSATSVSASSVPLQENFVLHSLSDAYPGLLFSLGKNGFASLVKSYLKSSLAKKTSSEKLASQLPEYLLRWKNPLKQTWQVDLAFLERGIFHSQQGEDPSYCDLGQLAEANPDEMETLQFQLEPSTSLHRTEWTIDDVWKKKSSKPKKEWRYLLVHRFKLKVKVISLTSEECAFLRDVISGLSLTEILELYPEQSTVRLLKDWAAQGVLRPLMKTRI